LDLIPIRDRYENIHPKKKNEEKKVTQYQFLHRYEETERKNP
jgi:hypothetical protein